MRFDSIFALILRGIRHWHFLRIVPVLIVGAFVIALQFSGCSQEITRAELAEIIAPAEPRVPGPLYYQGRKRGFDRFIWVRPYLGTEKFRIRVDDSPITEPFDYTSNKEEWKIINRLIP